MQHTDTSTRANANSAVKAQAVAAVLDLERTFRQVREAVDVDAARDALSKAVNELVNVREALGRPENILGSDATKHGQIAEMVEVAIRNARSYMDFAKPTAGVPHSATLPFDILISGVEVQMKTYNGANNSLGAVLTHLGKYEYFARDESYYLLPRDQYEEIQKVLSGTASNLSEKSRAAILAKVQEVERLTGRPGLSEFLCVRRRKTCPRRRASLATNARRGGQVAAACYAAGRVKRSP